MLPWGSACKERKGILKLKTHSTRVIYGYMIEYHSDSKRGNPLLLQHGLLFPISSKGSYI